MRELFLTLLSRRGAYGYELRQALDPEFGDLLPTLNAGQIYTTLARLERDGLVTGRDVPDDPRGKRVYEITDHGRAVLTDWVASPVPGTRSIVASVFSIPVGIGLYLGLYAVAGGGDDGTAATFAPWWWLAGVPLAVCLATVIVTAVPARLAVRISAANAVRYE